MINLIVATYFEAKPIILFYNLKRKIRIQEFHIYENPKLNISLTISGIGNIMSGAATSFTYCKYNKIKNNIWINFGLAGTKDEKIGEFFLVNKVSDFDKKKKSFFPIFAKDFRFKKKECISYHNKNENYNLALSDMESYGFFSVAERFSSREFIFLIKIVSDNQIESIDFFSREKVFRLINRNMENVAKFISNIEETLSNINNHQLNVLLHLNQLQKKFNFSYYQELRVKKLLNIFFSQKKIFEFENTILECNSINDVICRLEKEIED